MLQLARLRSFLSSEHFLLCTCISLVIIAASCSGSSSAGGGGGKSLRSACEPGSSSRDSSRGAGPASAGKGTAIRSHELARLLIETASDRTEQEKRDPSRKRNVKSSVINKVINAYTAELAR